MAMLMIAVTRARQKIESSQSTSSRPAVLCRLQHVCMPSPALACAVFSTEGHDKGTDCGRRPPHPGPPESFYPLVCWWGIPPEPAAVGLMQGTGTAGNAVVLGPGRSPCFGAYVSMGADTSDSPWIWSVVNRLVQTSVSSPAHSSSAVASKVCIIQSRLKRYDFLFNQWNTSNTAPHVAALLLLLVRSVQHLDTQAHWYTSTQTATFTGDSINCSNMQLVPIRNYRCRTLRTRAQLRASKTLWPCKVQCGAPSCMHPRCTYTP